MLIIIDVSLHGLLHYCYTNDVQLYFFISEWMASNRLKLNPSKSEFLLVSPSIWLQYLRTWWYWSPTSWHHRSLGVHFDSCSCCTTMTVHVSHLVRGCFYRLRRIKTIRKFIPTSATVILVNSFIVFRVDHYNSILAVLQTCQLDRIVGAKLRCLSRYMVGHHPIIGLQPMCCETTYIGCVIPAVRLHL